jgi:hypothetical protein
MAAKYGTRLRQVFFGASTGFVGSPGNQTVQRTSSMVFSLMKQFYTSADRIRDMPNRGT